MASNIKNALTENIKKRKSDASGGYSDIELSQLSGYETDSSQFSTCPDRKKIGSPASCFLGDFKLRKKKKLIRWRKGFYSL